MNNLDNLVNETNARIQEIIENFKTIKTEYENRLSNSVVEINEELETVKRYKQDFYESKQKIEKMNSDIEGFEEDYQNLVDRFKDDELANILIAANKEISAKIAERKRIIAKDQAAMNNLVEKAQESKKKLVKVTAEKKALELCLLKIIDAYEFYSRSLSQIVDYSEDNKENLSKCFYENDEEAKNNIIESIEKISKIAKSYDEAEDDEDFVLDLDDEENDDDTITNEEQENLDDNNQTNEEFDYNDSLES